MTSDELHALMDPEVRTMIMEHREDDPAAFALLFHGRHDLPVRAMAGQIACMQKAEKKLPTLFRFPLLYSRVALEQASGERAAAYKARLMSGKRLIDLTGGLGIDSIMLSQRFEEVVYCERDTGLAEPVSHNLRVLGIRNIDIRTGDSTKLLEACSDGSFDWIYADPARREGGRRAAGLQVSSPDMVSLHDTLLRKAPMVCIKASPVLEISGLRKLLPSLSGVTVVSVDQECKEVLLLLDRDRQQAGLLPVRAVCLDDGEFTLEGTEGEPRAGTLSGAPRGYLYEPDPAIIKARLVARLAEGFGLTFLNGSVGYLTSDRFLEGFPGRSFRVVRAAFYKPKSFSSLLESWGVRSASIQRRDFPLSPEEIRKRYRLGESDDVFLFFTKDAAGKLLVLCCEKP
jgi:hypothetical protein